MNRLAQTYKLPLSIKAVFVPVAGLFILLLMIFNTSDKTSICSRKRTIALTIEIKLL